MEHSVRSQRGWRGAIPHWQALSFFVALGLTQLFIYVNFKGEGLDKTVAMFYIIAPSLILTYLLMASRYNSARYSLDDLELVPMIAYGLLGFILSWAITLLLFGQLGGEKFGNVQIDSLWGTVLTQVLFVACSEELLFRYLLPAYLKGAFSKTWWIIPIALSQVSFAAFHWGVYGGSVYSLIVAFIFGMLMYGAYHIRIGKNELGLGFTIGCHAAYNLVLVGVLAGSVHIVSMVGGG